FDTDATMTIASQLGPPINFRCNEFGHLCSRAGGQPAHPNRTAPNADVNASVAYDECVSNDSEGYLRGTLDVATRIKSLKPDPLRVAVASIQGPPTPYGVHWKNSNAPDTSCTTLSCPWPEVTHSCTAADGSTGDPGVRTAQLAQAFGNNGVELSVCDDSFGPGL